MSGLIVTVNKVVIHRVVSAMEPYLLLLGTSVVIGRGHPLFLIYFLKLLRNISHVSLVLQMIIVVSELGQYACLGGYGFEAINVVHNPNNLLGLVILTSGCLYKLVFSLNLVDPEGILSKFCIGVFPDAVGVRRQIILLPDDVGHLIAMLLISWGYVIDVTIVLRDDLPDQVRIIT